MGARNETSQMSLSTSNTANLNLEYTTDPARIDLDRVHHWIARKSYWAGQMPRRVFDRAVRGSDHCSGYPDRTDCPDHPATLFALADSATQEGPPRGGLGTFLGLA